MDIWFYIISVIFVALCAGFSFQNGKKSGVMEGMEITLSLLEQQKLIRLSTDDRGQVNIEKYEEQNGTT